MNELPDDYGTPPYESRWIREKLGLPPTAKTGDVQGQMHILHSNAFGYVTYIAAYKCDDKQGEIARLSVALRTLAEKCGCLEPDDHGRPTCDPPCVACAALGRVKATEVAGVDDM